MTKKAAGKPADTSDVDDFLNETNPLIEKIEDITSEGLDLTQIPPPPEHTVVATNTKKDTVQAPKLTGNLKKFNFSRFGSGKRPITTDLSDAMLPPITKKRTAIYQLLGLDEGGSRDRRIDVALSDRGNRVDTSDYEMHPHYSIFDKYEADFGRQQKIVSFYDGVQRITYKDPITGELRPEVRQKVGTPKFVRGQAVVDIMRNYHQYLWWELHPGNATNKFRDKSKPALFERIDMKHYNPHTEMVRRELRLDAMNYVKKLSAQDAEALATALEIPTFREQPSTIKTALYTIAETDPQKVLWRSPNELVSITIEIMRAVDLGILDFDAINKSYFFAQNSTEPIYVVPMGENPQEALAHFLIENEDGRVIKEKMLEYIYYWF